MRTHEFYKALVRLYPKPFRERFGASIVQTLSDLERERRAEGQSQLLFNSIILIDTTTSILRENVSMLQVNTTHLRNAAAASLVLLILPLVLTLANPASRLRGGGGGGFDWMPGSFLVMGLMLFGVVLALQIAAKQITRPTSRIAAIAAVVAVFGLIWAELAVDAVSQAVASIV